MLFAFGLVLLGTGGFVAVRSCGAKMSRKRGETIAGLLLSVGLFLIGWGLNIRR